MDFNLEDFYTKFILIDLMAKIAPGSFIIFSIILSLDLEKNNFILIFNWINQISLWNWIFLISLSLITGFAIQGLGENIGNKYHSSQKDKSDLREDYERWVKFQNVATTYEKVQLQRFSAIKEACGNGFVALITSGLFLIFGAYIKSTLQLNRNNFFIFFIYLFFIILLRYMHQQHVERQGLFLRIVLDIHQQQQDTLALSKAYSKVI